jgi:hypothetical protein
MAFLGRRIGTSSPGDASTLTARIFEHTCWFCPQTMLVLADRTLFKVRHFQLIEDCRPDRAVAYRTFVGLTLALAAVGARSESVAWNSSSQQGSVGGAPEGIWTTIPVAILFQFVVARTHATNRSTNVSDSVRMSIPRSTGRIQEQKRPNATQVLFVRRQTKQDRRVIRLLWKIGKLENISAQTPLKQQSGVVSACDPARTR